MAETGVWSEYRITAAGRKFRQRCFAEGIKPVFPRAAIGTGKPADPLDIDSITELMEYSRDVIIKKSYLQEENHLCVVRVDNTEYTQDVFMSEVATYIRGEDQPDSEAILYGYAYCLDGYIRIPAQNGKRSLKVYELTLDTYCSAATEIEIVFDAHTVYVSHADLDDALAHSAYNANHELVTIQHNLGRFPGCDAACLEYAAGIAPAGEGYPGGTDPVTFRPEVKHHSRNALTVLVPQKYAREVAAVNQLRDNEYAVIYKEGIESLLILLR